MLALGHDAGSPLTSGSNNILLSNPGAAVESGAIRIGATGTQSSAFIAGISGASVAGTPQLVLIGANGQLGTTIRSPS